MAYLQNVQFVLWELLNFKCDKETEFRAGLINGDFKIHKTGKDEEIKTYILDGVFLAIIKIYGARSLSRNQWLIRWSTIPALWNLKYRYAKSPPMVCVHNHRVLSRISKAIYSFNKVIIIIVQ